MVMGDEDNMDFTQKDQSCDRMIRQLEFVTRRSFNGLEEMARKPNLTYPRQGFKSSRKGYVSRRCTLVPMTMKGNGG